MPGRRVMFMQEKFNCNTIMIFKFLVLLESDVFNMVPTTNMSDELQIDYENN